MPYRFQVSRNRKCAIAYYFIYTVIVQTIIAFAANGVSYGTYLAASSTDDYIAVAIESRRTENTPSGRRFVDDECKIVVLSPKAIFIAEGTIANIDPRAPKFDGFNVARNSYRSATPAGSLMGTAILWADEMIPRLAEIYPFYKDLFDHRHDNQSVVGYFFGIDSDGSLSGVKAMIIHLNDSFTREFLPIPKPRLMLGPWNLVKEFFEGQTDRATIARLQYYKERAGKSPAEAEVILLKSLVQHIPIWAGDPGSGGDIAQVIIDGKDKRWRWFHRPNFCPEN